MLDEPANGLDPAGIRYLRRLLPRLAADGMTVFLSSHLLAEVQELCARVAIVAAGRIVYEGEIEELRARAGRRYRLTAAELERAAAVCAAVHGVAEVELVDGQVTFAVDGDDALLGLTRAFADAGLAVLSLVPEQLTLERVFFELTEGPAEREAVPA
jgi:ABC-2 type transport system ATP-binding protein